MSLSVVLLVIASALAHATWNAILKRSKDPENAIFAMMTVASAVGLIVAFALRMRMPTPTVLGWILASGLLEAAYFVALARALSRAPLGSVYTVVRGGALLLVWPVSVAFLNETITLERALGTALVMLGLASTSMAERRKTDPALKAAGAATAAAATIETATTRAAATIETATTRATATTETATTRAAATTESATTRATATTEAATTRAAATTAAATAGAAAAEDADAKKVRSGLVVAAVCALFVAGYHLAYKLALGSGGRPEAVNSLSLTFAVIVNLILLKPSRRPLALRVFRDEPIRTVIGGVLGSVGFLIFLFAMKDAGAGIVLTLRNTSILFAQALGFALGERPKRLGVIGAVLVTVGAVFLSRG